MQWSKKSPIQGEENLAVVPREKTHDEGPASIEDFPKSFMEFVKGIF